MAAEDVEYSEFGNKEIDGALYCTCECMTSDCHQIRRLAAVGRFQCVGDNRSAGSVRP